MPKRSARNRPQSSPLLTGNQWCWPAINDPSPRCPHCQASLLGAQSLAYLNAGAIVDLDEFPDDAALEGFLSIYCHSADESQNVSVDLATDVYGGQFSWSFCSLKCLGDWFNGHIQRLIAQQESQIETSRKKAIKVSKGRVNKK